MRSLIVFAVLLVIFSAAVLLAVTKVRQQPKELQSSQTPTPLPIVSPQPESVEITAFFTIITNEVVRSFKATKYYNRSADVFIKADDPTKVYLKKKGISWGDFFATLPMKLTKQCLTTGDGENFCDGQDGSLKFYINNTEDQSLLDKEIKNGNSALTRFTSY